MAISLKTITEENFEECISLSLKDGQDEFIDSNLYSIAESKVIPEYLINAIYNDDVIVGFVMYALNFKYGNDLYINRLMIDKHYQRKGYAKATLDLLKEIAKSTQSISRMTLSTDKKNLEAINLYEEFGFINTGRVDNGEDVFELILN